jgi:hypothetical protein
MNEETQNDEGVTDEGVVVDNDGNAINPEDAALNKDKQESAAERPEWLDEKFKTPEDLAKSYRELEKTLREKGRVAPDVYELSEDIKLEPDETLEAFNTLAKEANLTNDQYNAIISFALKSDLLGNQDYEAELEKIGGPDGEIIKTITSFAQAKLNDAERATLETMVYSADQAKLINKLVRASQNSGIPSKVESVKTNEELQVEYNGLMSKHVKQGLSAAEKERVEKIASQIF